MTTTATPPAASHIPEPIRPQRVSWGAIFVGAAIALALMVLFSTIGLAIGAMTIDPEGGLSLGGLTTFSLVYIVVTQLISVAAGAFAAARLAGIPRMVAAVAHGASVWAVTTLIVAYMAVAGGAAVLTATSSMLQATARGVGEAAQAVAPEDISFPNVSRLAGEVSFADLPPEVRSTLNENDITPQQLGAALQDAFRDAVSRQEQQRAIAIMQGAFADALRNPGEIQTNVDQAIDRLVAGEDAVLSQEDVAEARRTLATSLDLTEQEVDQIIGAVEQRLDQAVTELRQTVQTLQERAVRLTEQASETMAQTAWGLALASVLGLLAAVGAGAAGRPKDMLGDRVQDHGPL